MDDIQSIHLSGSEVHEAEPAVGLLGLIGLGDEVVFHVSEISKGKGKRKFHFFMIFTPVKWKQRIVQLCYYNGEN